jgi:hypothetical protein
MNATNDVTAIVVAMMDAEGPFLGACLRSVLGDPGVARLILCIQDSNSWIDEVLASVPKDSRLEVLRLPLGPAGAIRNAAVKLVTTEWLAFCDGDDVWCKGKTRAQRAHADKTPCDMVGVDHYLTDEGGRIRAVAMAKYLPMTSSWMVRTKTMREHPFREEKNYNGIEDSEWWKRTYGVVQKSRCPKLLLRYRVRTLSLSTKEPSKIRKARAVAMASIPVIGLGVLALTCGVWLVNRSESYRRLYK